MRTDSTHCLQPGARRGARWISTCGSALLTGRLLHKINACESRVRTAHEGDSVKGRQCRFGIWMSHFTRALIWDGVRSKFTKFYPTRADK